MNHITILFLYYLKFQIILALIYFFFSKAGSDQKRLLSKLFENYNPLERPAADEGESLYVGLSLSIQQIIDVVLNSN